MMTSKNPFRLLLVLFLAATFLYALPIVTTYADASANPCPNRECRPNR